MSLSPQLPFDFSVSEKATFANFLVSGKNAELFAFLKTCSAATEPFAFLWGRPGTGKSHLLQGLCHDIEDKGGLQALYLPMEKLRVFGPEVFNSLHHMDLICMDDVDCVAGDRAWEVSLFEFFNRSREAGVKILASAAAPPRRLPFVLPDLASRMTWGVIYQLHELDDEEKLAALDRRARDKHMPLAPDVLQYIYLRHSRDLQHLLEVLDRLDQLSLAEKRKLTIPFVRQVMGWQ